MALNGIMSSALSALQTNTAALRVVSNNVANLNTPNYARRVVNEQTLAVGGQLAGVDISDIQRVVDQFLNQETLSAGGSSAQYDAQTSVFSQLNQLLGQPGDSTSLTSQLSSVFSALGQSVLSPTNSASQLGSVNAFQNLASTISGLSSTISTLQSQVDSQVQGSIGTVNALIKQIFQLNTQIQSATVTGNGDSALLDQRDQALQSLSQLVGIRTVQQSDGSMAVMTNDGISLVGSTYAQLTYPGGGSNGSYGSIAVQNIDPSSGQPIGTSQALDPHLASGKLKGLIDMRDGTLSDLAQELGNLARNTALAFNEQHNANSAFPPPTALTGRDTGLLAGDALNFSGKTTLAVADANGNLVSRIDIDFGAGTLSVDGGAATAFGGTIGGLTTALNTALGANGTASFADGVLSIGASGGNGIVVQDDTATPSDRGGYGFSQFFGLNDLFTAAAPSILSTGLSASDASGLATGGVMQLALKGPDGDIAKQASVTITAGMTIGDVVSALNTAMGGAATFTLNSDGSITTAPGAGYPNYQLAVTDDTTQRGTTGLSFSQLFGIGVGQAGAQASGFALNSAIIASPQRLAFAQATITPASVAGDTIVAHGDSRGALALQNIGTAQQTFAKAGNLGGQVSSLSDYAGAFYQDVATRSQTATTNQTAQDDRLQEAQSRQSQNAGVNLDEELSNMMVYQQAYNAGARVLSVVQQLYDTLLQIP